MRIDREIIDSPGIGMYILIVGEYVMYANY